MRREKRSARLVAHVPHSLREQYEMFVAEGKVISMSDYLFGVLEEHAAVRVVKQKIGRRAGQQ
jgi:hypothetical protein